MADNSSLVILGEESKTLPTLSLLQDASSPMTNIWTNSFSPTKATMHSPVNHGSENVYDEPFPSASSISTDEIHGLCEVFRLDMGERADQAGPDIPLHLVDSVSACTSKSWDSDKIYDRDDEQKNQFNSARRSKSTFPAFLGGVCSATVKVVKADESRAPFWNAWQNSSRDNLSKMRSLLTTMIKLKNFSKNMQQCDGDLKKRANAPTKSVEELNKLRHNYGDNHGDGSAPFYSISFQLKATDPIVLSWNNKKDRRVKSMSVKYDCSITIEPIHRGLEQFALMVQSTQKKKMEKCLSALRQVFPKSTLEKKHILFY